MQPAQAYLDLKCADSALNESQNLGMILSNNADLSTETFASVMDSLASSSKDTDRKINDNISVNTERSQQLLKDLQKDALLISSDDVRCRIEDHIERLEKAVTKQDVIYRGTSGPYITLNNAVLALEKASVYESP